MMRVHRFRGTPGLHQAGRILAFALTLALFAAPLSLSAQTIGLDDSFRVELGDYTLDILPLTGSFALSNSAGIVLKQNSDYGSFFRRVREGELQKLSDVTVSVRVYTAPDEAGFLYTFTDGSEALLTFRRVQTYLSLEFSQTAASDAVYQVLLDTVTGETGPNHFTRAGAGINRELSEALSPSSQRFSLTATGADASNFALAAQVFAGRLNVSVANIRRLGEAIQGFQANSNRNFNLLPFSINDSGVLLEAGATSGSPVAFQVLLGLGTGAQVLPTSTAPAAVSRTRGQLFSNPAVVRTAGRTPGSDGTGTQGSTAGNAASATNGAASSDGAGGSTTAGRSAGDPQVQARLEKLSALNELLARIDELLARPNPSEEEVAILRQLFATLLRTSDY